MPTPVPIIVDDGNYTTAQQVDAALPKFPFANLGDAKTFTQEVTMRQDVDSFTPPIIGTPRSFSIGSNYYDASFDLIDGSGYFPITNGTSYLVNISPARLVGGRLVEWNETYASIPLRRVECGVTTASFSFFVDTYLCATWTGQCDARFVYEYSLNEPLTPLYKYYSDPAGGIDIPGSAPSGFDLALPSGHSLSENSSSKIWMGNIYERLSTYALMPPIVWTPCTPP